MCAKHLRESQDLTQWRDIFCQWIGKLNVVKVSHSQIYIQIKSDLNQIPLCFCMSEIWQADLKFTLLFSHLVMSDSLWPQGLQHTRLPCPSPTPGACSNLCPLTQWCHPTISSSVIPFSSLLQSFPASGPFPMSQFFPTGGQSIGTSASASLLPVNIQDWFPLGLAGFLSLPSKGLSRVFCNTTVLKHRLFGSFYFSFSFISF